MSPAGLLTKGEYRVAKFAHDWKPRTRRVAKCGCKCKVELPGTARSGLQSPICKSRPRIFLAYGWIHQQARSWRDPEECRRNHNNGSPVIWPEYRGPLQRFIWVAGALLAGPAVPPICHGVAEGHRQRSRDGPPLEFGNE